MCAQNKKSPYTERARRGYEALIDLKALSWRYMNICGMCSDPQHSAPVLVLANHRNRSYSDISLVTRPLPPQRLVLSG